MLMLPLQDLGSGWLSGHQYLSISVSSSAVSMAPNIVVEQPVAVLKTKYTVAKADHQPREKKKFYHLFSIVKYSYLPTDTFRKYVEMHVT